MDVLEEELQPLYDYVDGIPLSRPKRNIARDFADGVLVAELVHHENPRIVELHNYSSANSLPQKLYNWDTLNQKVFKRHLGFILAKSELEGVCNCEVGSIERVLKLLRVKLDEYKEKQAQEKREAALRKDSPPSSQAKPRPADARLHLLHGPTATATITVGAAQKHNQESASAELVIKELRETNELLSLKAEKLEQLLLLKDAKISGLAAKLQEAGIAL